MKKINKLAISPEKMMKNEELINLKGGYGDLITCETGTRYCCSCDDGSASWAGCYSSDTTKDKAIAKHCVGGGTCYKC